MKQKYNKDVHYICKLSGIKRIEKEYGKLKNYDVVLTNERKEHILDRRRNDGVDILINLKSSIENYDYLLDAGDFSIRYIKVNETKNYAYIVKLSINNKNKANSVISGIIIDSKKIKKYIRKYRIIDSKWYNKLVAMK